jgi:2-keto-4-pentenoate hydratase/2-oxohepta-3-ene-1,7-dioic acid hydratase in catechol pathway
VMGPEAKGVQEGEAYRHVFGYTCLLDITLRMTETEKEERSMRKSYATFTPVGPVLITADEIPDPENLNIRLLVNGEVRQQASTKDLIVKIPELIAISSRVVPLKAGDIIATGTPQGIGEIKAGDVVEIEIEQVGKMILPVSKRSW